MHLNVRFHKTKWGWLGLRAAPLVVMTGLCATTLSWSPNATAGIFSYFDIDGTIFHDSGLLGGKLPAFQTPWVLTRLMSPNNGLGLAEFDAAVASGELPPNILVTRHEIDQILVGKLAQGEAQVGSTESIELEPFPVFQSLRFAGFYRPKSIVPGFYRIVEPLAYRFHRDELAGENVLLDSFNDAVALVSTNPKKYSWKGTAFSHFQHALERQGPNSRVFLLTDRDSRQASVDALLATMNTLGEIPAPSVQVQGETFSPKILSMSDARARRHGSVLDFQARKAERIASDVAAINRSAIPKHRTLSPDFNHAQQGLMMDMHEVRIYENDPEKVTLLLRRARELAAHFPDIKFLLFHAGDEAQVAGADFNRSVTKPSRWVVFTSSGVGWRQPMGPEILELEVKGCEHAFKK